MDKEKRYIFPDFMAEVMKKVDTRVQFEASLMSMLFILIGMFVMAGYMIFFTDFTLFMKIMVGVNSIAGFTFMWSYLITTYQQYLSYMEATEVMSTAGVTLDEIRGSLDKLGGAIAPAIAIDLKRKEEKDLLPTKEEVEEKFK